MKKLILSASLSLCVAAGALAQGTISFDNYNGTGSASATSFGLFFYNPGSGPVAIQSGTLTATLMGGASLGAETSLLTPVVNLGYATSANVSMSYGGIPGQFGDSSGSTWQLAGVPQGNTGYFEILVSDTIGGLHYTGSAFFHEALSGGFNTAPSMDAMPAVILTVPEPGTFALAGLGAAALLIFRRRK